MGFKPYYKWNTFNTNRNENARKAFLVLNLIINGIPSIQRKCRCRRTIPTIVLNLIINGIPSIL